MASPIRNRCPHCASVMLIRTSKNIHPLLKILYLQCKNYQCGFSCAASVEIVHTISPSASPNPEIVLLTLAEIMQRKACNDDVLPNKIEEVKVKPIKKLRIEPLDIEETKKYQMQNTDDFKLGDLVVHERGYPNVLEVTSIHGNNLLLLTDHKFGSHPFSPLGIIRLATEDEILAKRRFGTTSEESEIHLKWSMSKFSNDDIPSEYIDILKKNGMDED